MFTTFQGGPFVEVFTPQVRAVAIAPRALSNSGRNKTSLLSVGGTRASNGRRSISGGVRVRAVNRDRLAITIANPASPPRGPFPRRAARPLAPTLSSMLTRPCRQTNVDCRADAGEGPDGGVEDVVRREVGETPVREECEGIRVHHRRRPGAQDAVPKDERRGRVSTPSLVWSVGFSLARRAPVDALPRPSPRLTLQRPPPLSFPPSQSA